MVKTKWWLEARQTLIKESHFLIEKLQVMSRNYTIDYEEYRNRKNVWCTTINNPAWSGTNSCTIMTHYGNRNILWLNAGASNVKNILYRCSSTNDWALNSLTVQPIVKSQLSADISNCTSVMSGASAAITTAKNLSWFIQSYGQYKSLFMDVKDDVDLVPGAYKDDDDLDRWNGPDAIHNATGVQELYLVSHDGNYRLYIRKKLIEQWDWNKNGTTGDVDSEKLYALQMLQLRWLDAWDNHDFTIASSSGVYDGKIDTWACDYAAWFICAGSNIWGAYTGYRLPATIDDGRVTLTPTDITLSDWNIIISPIKDSYFTWADTSSQLSPYFQIQFTAKLYGKVRSSKIPWTQMNLYSLRLQTVLQSPFLWSKK